MVNNTSTSLSVGRDIKKVNIVSMVHRNYKWNGRLAPFFSKWNDMDISFVFSQKKM
jgi:hypothetical protein